MDGGIRESRHHGRLTEGGACGYLTVDLAAIRRNYEALSAVLAPARAAAVVKADAYGLSAARVAPVLYGAGCRDFFVAQFVEATDLRSRLADDARIYVLNGLQPGSEAACAEYGIIPVLNSIEQLQRWKDLAVGQNARLPAVLQFDTGMSRLGIAPEERTIVSTELHECEALDIRYIMSHLASADEPDSPQNADQLNAMTAIAAEFPAYPVSFANSGGVFLGDSYHGALARPGIALYGGIEATGLPCSIEPVVRLDVAVVQTRTVPHGALVGYGGAHATTGVRRLATLSAGYADGLPRSLSHHGAVYHQGMRLPIVGRVSMDSMTVDVTDLPEGTLRLGSLVEVIGPHQTLEQLAETAGTISYEILTSLGRRYQRIYR